MSAWQNSRALSRVRVCVKARECLILTLLFAAFSPSATAQQLPDAPSHPWQPPQKLHLMPPAEAPPLASPAEQLSLPALIDIAEQRNPETRAAWQEARAAAASKGIARSALLPTLTGLVLSQTTREPILFGTAFYRQTEGTVEPALELDYTVFDWNERLDALRAARSDLFAEEFSFNNAHLTLMDQVATSYFQLLNAQGQVAAAQANLQNARTVAAQVDARLANGLATLPDALEARAQAAQAAYELTSLKGAQSIAATDLATTLRLPAGTALPVVPYERLAPPDALAQTAAEAVAHALTDRPDLLSSEARVAAAAERIRQARTAYLPDIVFTGQWGRARGYGDQDQLPPVYGAVGVWNAQLDLRWTLFDGGERSGQIARAIAEKAEAEERLNAQKDEIEDQVWTAYTDAQTALAQQGAAAALLAAAQSSYNADTEAYGDGVRTLVDVVTAERALAQARSEAVSARTNAFEQTTALAFRSGALLRSHAGPVILPPAIPGPDSGAGSSAGPISATDVKPGSTSGKE